MAPSGTTCAGKKGSVIHYFVVSRSMAAFVQGSSRVDPSPTTRHWPVRLTLLATRWRRVVFARRKPEKFPAESQMGPKSP